MKWFLGLAATGIIAVLGTGPVQAAEVEGEFDFGLSAASGNTESLDGNAGFKLVSKSRVFRDSFYGKALYQSEDGDKTGERYGLGWKTEWLFSGHRHSLFFALDGERDEFAALRDRATATIGYGYLLIDEPEHKLNTEIGIGGRYTETNLGVSDEEGVGKLGLLYSWAINDNADFSQSLQTEAGTETDQVITTGDTALRIGLFRQLHLKAGFNFKHTSDVQAPTKDLDTLTTIGLSWTFGNVN